MKSIVFTARRVTTWRKSLEQHFKFKDDPEGLKKAQLLVRQRYQSEYKNIINQLNRDIPLLEKSFSELKNKNLAPTQEFEQLKNQLLDSAQLLIDAGGVLYETDFSIIPPENEIASQHLSSHLKKQTTSSRGSLTGSSVKKQGIPRCPDCGSGMTVRVAKSGRYRGRSFYGCIRYPRCKGIVSKHN